MTLIHLYRKYKRWNPVHATAGAFWGFGVGVGCGVGWGPGFGPDVVGYVGAGCGFGFSVGVTLLGVGIGIPAGGLTCVPCNAAVFAAERSMAVCQKHVWPPLGGLLQRAADGASFEIREAVAAAARQAAASGGAGGMTGAVGVAQAAAEGAGRAMVEKPVAALRSFLQTHGGKVVAALIKIIRP